MNDPTSPAPQSSRKQHIYSSVHCWVVTFLLELIFPWHFHIFRRGWNLRASHSPGEGSGLLAAEDISVLPNIPKSALPEVCVCLSASEDTKQKQKIVLRTQYFWCQNRRERDFIDFKDIIRVTCCWERKSNTVHVWSSFKSHMFSRSYTLKSVLLNQNHQYLIEFDLAQH